MRLVSLCVLAVVGLGVASVARADDVQRFSAGGYFRVMTRPDFQGGNSRLGYSTLYGRLLNEGPYAALDLELDLVPERAETGEPWTALHGKIEGGSVRNADASLGRLDAFSLSQLYVVAGNVAGSGVRWRVGTLDDYLGDLGLFDARPAELFADTLGVSASWQNDWLEVLAGAGDAGYAVRREGYDTVLSVGGRARVRFSEHLVLGAGAQVRYEPRVPGNRFAPHSTPGVDYEDFLRGEVVQRYLEENPGREAEFPDPVAQTASSVKLIGQLAFGQLGRLEWNNLFAAYERLHPELSVQESFDGDEYVIYVSALTDERVVWVVGDQIQATVVPGLLDAAAAVLYTNRSDVDNSVAPSNYDSTELGSVLRLQTYLTKTVHLLTETSYAVETSANGNRYREHADSVFASTGGVADSRGLEFGDASRRRTWQGKAGLVLNPRGLGIFSRPSLRALYGVQWSSENSAFGNSYVTTLDELDAFGSPENHWHHVVAVETEAWF